MNSTTNIHTKKSADSFLLDNREVALLSFFFIAFFALAPIEFKQKGIKP